jgi:hypothetical protein
MRDFGDQPEEKANTPKDEETGEKSVEVEENPK